MSLLLILPPTHYGNWQKITQFMNILHFDNFYQYVFKICEIVVLILPRGKKILQDYFIKYSRMHLTLTVRSHLVTLGKFVRQVKWGQNWGKKNKLCLSSLKWRRNKGRCRCSLLIYNDLNKLILNAMQTSNTNITDCLKIQRMQCKLHCNTVFDNAI